MRSSQDAYVHADSSQNLSGLLSHLLQSFGLHMSVHYIEVHYSSRPLTAARSATFTGLKDMHCFVGR